MKIKDMNCSSDKDDLVQNLSFLTIVVRLESGEFMPTKNLIIPTKAPINDGLIDGKVTSVYLRAIYRSRSIVSFFLLYFQGSGYEKHCAKSAERHKNDC